MVTTLPTRPATDECFDAVIIGGGPGGSTAALCLARAGLRAVVLERAPFPRFHIGESFLPRNFELLRALGLLERLRAIPHVQKLGAEFGFGDGDGDTARFRFDGQLGGGEHEAFNVERAAFDAMLLDAARDAGAVVREGAAVRRVLSLEDGAVAVALDGGDVVRGRCLVDASGQGTVVGRHLKTRRVIPHLRKVAYFAHLENVQRLDGDAEGYPTIIMCSEGWFWLIPIDARRTSVGLVLDADAAKAAASPPDRMLRWGIERCPAMRRRIPEASWPRENGVTADFSYRCTPYAGPGYFLVGDAATFVDPVFSTGACIAMLSAVEAAASIQRILRDGADPARERRRFIRYVKGSSSTFFRLVDHFYKHEFRELFVHGTGPLAVHRAVIGVLSGHVFPRPRFALRWRVRLFDLFVWLQRRVALVPRRPSFSLLDAAAPDAAAVSTRRVTRAEESLLHDVAHP